MESLIEDYLTSIYERYAHFGSTPYITQLKPTEKNRQAFEIWIHKWGENHNYENYWAERSPNYARAKAAAQRHFLGSLPLDKILDDVNILEV